MRNLFAIVFCTMCLAGGIAPMSSALAENLLLNGDFSIGEPPEHWVSPVGEHGNLALIARDSSDFHSAPFSIALTGKTFIYQEIDAQPFQGRTLTFKAWGKADANSGMKMVVRVFGETRTDIHSDYLDNQKVLVRFTGDSPTDWIRVDHNFEVPIDAYWVMIIFNVPSGVARFDDAVLCESCDGPVELNNHPVAADSKSRMTARNYQMVRFHNYASEVPFQAMHTLSGRRMVSKARAGAQYLIGTVHK